MFGWAQFSHCSVIPKCHFCFFSHVFYQKGEQNSAYLLMIGNNINRHLVYYLPRQFFRQLTTLSTTSNKKKKLLNKQEPLESFLLTCPKTKAREIFQSGWMGQVNLNGDHKKQQQTLIAFSRVHSFAKLAPYLFCQEFLRPLKKNRGRCSRKEECILLIVAETRSAAGGNAKNFRNLVGAIRNSKKTSS